MENHDVCFCFCNCGGCVALRAYVNKLECDCSTCTLLGHMFMLPPPAQGEPQYHHCVATCLCYTCQAVKREATECECLPCTVVKPKPQKPKTTS